MKKFLLLTGMLLACVLMQAQGNANRRLQMPHFFADGMVVQRDTKVPVWGKGVAGEKIVVAMNGLRAQTKVKTDGTSYERKTAKRRETAG